ncbi:MAG: transposase [Anaerolineales bacterium]|nr:MAG: transposase [Anaerolineales bacterium]
MDFRRYYVPNAVVFITQVVQGRAPIFRDEAHLALLRFTLRRVKELHPFSALGYVFLPDHFHLLIKPTGDSTFSQIMHSLKPNFTKAYKRAIGMTGSVKFWQKRFWEHTIRDEKDFECHLDYIHFNPVKHGLVTKPEDWVHSSFLVWKERGAYPDGWGRSIPPSIAEFDWSSGE